jgi:hypothetical protein
MGLFDKIFGDNSQPQGKERPKQKVDSIEQKIQNSNLSPEEKAAFNAFRKKGQWGATFILALDHLSTPKDQVLAQCFANLRINAEPAKYLNFGQNSSESFTGTVCYEPHRIHLMGFNLPAPVLEFTLTPSHFPPETKAPIANHRAHIVAIYSGDVSDPTEQYLALFCLARAFKDQGLLGILNEAAMNALPAKAVIDYTEPDVIATCRGYFPPYVFSNLVQFFRPDGKVWLVSKGHHVFGVPDFAFLAAEMGHMDSVTNLFGGLFDYVHKKKAVFRAGETAKFGKMTVKFSRVTEYKDYIEGPGETLVTTVS